MQETPKEVNLLWPLLVKWDETSERQIYWAELSTASVFSSNLLPLSQEESLTILSKVWNSQTPEVKIPEFISIADSRIKSISEKGQNGKLQAERFSQQPLGGSPQTSDTPHDSATSDIEDQIETI